MMLTMRNEEFNEVLQKIEEIESLQEPHPKFSSMNLRQRSEKFRLPHEVFSALIEKSVGGDQKNQVGFLMYHLKKLCPKGGVLAAAVDDFKSLQNFNTITKKQRKSSHYKTFDKLLVKFSGTNNPDIHRSFLEVRFWATHGNERGAKPLIEESSWNAVKLMIEELTRDIEQKTDVEQKA